MLLLDTHVVSEVRKHSWHPNVKAGMIAQAAGTLYICAITVLEIQRGISLAAQRGDEPQAAILNRWLAKMVLPAFAGRILPVDHLVARRAARLTWVDAQAYRDPLIAAPGLVHGAAVVTRNIKHFEASGVHLVTPWEFVADK
ncbi:type II toxin-antitoxin system VapC family toxin [Variovorax sp. J31P216]|nr:type II toxin-antitoxin system VapC family toxin [Variovorax sp. J31P216]